MPSGLSVGEIAIMIVVLAIGLALLWFVAAIIVRTVLRFSEELRGPDSGSHRGD